MCRETEGAGRTLASLSPSGARLSRIPICALRNMPVVCQQMPFPVEGMSTQKTIELFLAGDSQAETGSGGE